CLHSVDDATSFSDEAVMLAVGPLGILVLHCRDLDHLAVITLATQPAKKGAFEQLGVEPVSLGAPMLARHRYTRCVNDIGLDTARLEPARQPDAVPAGLEADRDALYPASCLLRFLSPSMQQLQQCALVDHELFQRLALNARHDTGNEPALQAHLNDCNQRAVRFEGGEGSIQVVQLLHRGAPSVHISDDGMQYPRRRPIASSMKPDLKKALEAALNEKVKVKKGDKEVVLAKAIVGIQHLVNQFAKGDRHARRDVFQYAELLGVDL